MFLASNRCDVKHIFQSSRVAHASSINFHIDFSLPIVFDCFFASHPKCGLAWNLYRQYPNLKCCCVSDFLLIHLILYPSVHSTAAAERWYRVEFIQFFTNTSTKQLQYTQLWAFSSHSHFYSHHNQTLNQLISIASIFWQLFILYLVHR